MFLWHKMKGLEMSGAVFAPKEGNAIKKPQQEDPPAGEEKPTRSTKRQPRGTNAKERAHRHDDSLWKEVLSRHFVPMLRSVLPEMAQALDESRSVRFLETELRRLARFVKPYSQPSPDGKKFVDILAEVPLCSGEDAWILLHVEIQGRGGKENFPLRMHYYRCLLEGRYHRPVAGLALLIQPLPEDQEEGLYQWSMFRSKVLYEYPVFRLY